MSLLVKSRISSNVTLTQTSRVLPASRLQLCANRKCSQNIYEVSGTQLPDIEPEELDDEIKKLIPQDLTEEEFIATRTHKQREEYAKIVSHYFNTCH